MNRKGFTLIELLAVIVILAIIMVIGAPSLMKTFKATKRKNEQIFVDRLSESIDAYVELNNDSIAFAKQSGTKTKSDISGNYTVSIYKGQITFQDIIDDKLIDDNDFINAGNEKVVCNKDAAIEVYRDSEYVYCHKVKKAALGCLTTDYKNSISGTYVINTCVWQ